MDAVAQTFYKELRNTKMELKKKLEEESSSPVIRDIMMEELADIDATIRKIENNAFGICEASGELIPFELLKMMPTMKTLEDVEELDQYYRKSLFE